LKTYSLRLDPKTVKELEDKGYNISELLRELLEQVAKTKKCPTCGTKLK
jgi:CRISPR/Cas system-associated exonuclease Cas4 (RecB family)